MGGNYWLLKTEPEEWSWDHQESKGGISHWDGVKNAQAQINMKKMEEGDECFFYHTGRRKEIVGVVRVSRTWYPEPETGNLGAEETSEVLTEQSVARVESASVNEEAPHKKLGTEADKGATRIGKGKKVGGKRVYGMVDVVAMRKLESPVTLADLKGSDDEALADLALFRQPRLSVVPITEKQWQAIFKLGELQQQQPQGRNSADVADATNNDSHNVGQAGGESAGASNSAEHGDKKLTGLASFSDWLKPSNGSLVEEPGKSPEPVTLELAVTPEEGGPQKQVEGVSKRAKRTSREVGRKREEVGKEEGPGGKPPQMPQKGVKGLSMRKVKQKVEDSIGEGKGQELRRSNRKR